MIDYKVIRAHWGDKEYKVGDVRTASHADVAHLIGRCLEEVKAELKAERPLKNKSAKYAKNKAAD